MPRPPGASSSVRSGQESDLLRGDLLAVSFTRRRREAGPRDASTRASTICLSGRAHPTRGRERETAPRQDAAHLFAMASQQSNSLIVPWLGDASLCMQSPDKSCNLDADENINPLVLPLINYSVVIRRRKFFFFLLPSELETCCVSSISCRRSALAAPGSCNNIPTGRDHKQRISDVNDWVRC